MDRKVVTLNQFLFELVFLSCYLLLFLVAIRSAVCTDYETEFIPLLMDPGARHFRCNYICLCQ